MADSYWILTGNKSVYKDHSKDPSGDYMAASDIVRKAQGAAGAGGTTDQSFPVRLHYMLNEIEGDGLAHIISWAPHGRAFVVHNPKVFTEQVLGNWFRMSKYASFQRQLNIYGFQRLTTGPEKGGYFHELFLRTKPGLAYRIQRHKVKGTGTRKAAVPELEPDFYHMPSLPPNKTHCWTKATQVEQQAATKVGLLVKAGPQGFCSSTTTTTLPIAPAGGINCSLASLAPMLLSEKPPHRPSITTGFSVYSSGAATAHSRPHQLPRSPFTSSATNKAAALSHGLVASSGDGSSNCQQRILSALTSSTVAPPPQNSITNQATVATPYPTGSKTPATHSPPAPPAPLAPRSTGYVGPLVHPLLRENPTIMQGSSSTGSNAQGIFTPLLTSPGGGSTANNASSNSTRLTAGTGGTTRSTSQYEVPIDFSFAIPSFM